MRSRLAFGISMAFDFDYYLIDELMAVGDAQFRRKCQQVFETRLINANLILVSHNMADIRQWCDVVVLVKDGTAVLFEDVEEGITAYQGTPAAARPRPPRPTLAPQAASNAAPVAAASPKAGTTAGAPLQSSLA
jgi:capsular polysaccharide transport system ATP-binding protein